MAERVPPHSDDAEKAVLGSAMQSQNALYDIMETLVTEDFYREQHKVIFDSIRSLYSESQNVDIVTVAEELAKRKAINITGGRAYLSELTDVVPSPSSALQYGKIVKEKSMLRHLVENAGDIISTCYEDKLKTDDILDSAESSILEIAQGNQKKEGTQLSKAVGDALKQSEAYQKSGKSLMGLTTGLDDLDKITKGLQKKDLVILAARPSMGKTALALNIALNAAKAEKVQNNNDATQKNNKKNNGASIMIFSLEMGEIPLAQRMLSTLSMVELNKVRDGSFINNQEETERIDEAIETIRNLNIVIDESSGISVNEMKNKCRRHRQKAGHLDLIVVDYLQLMSLPGSNRPETRTLEVAMISRMLKEMAKEMDCPVLVLSQTSRDYEKRKGRPMLSDLRDSGAIEQDADLIIFIHNRAEREEDENGFVYDPKTMRELLILKHRNGETGEVFLSWRGKYQIFKDADTHEAADYENAPSEENALPF